MPVALEIQEVCDGCFTWQAYSPQSKVELTSHAIVLDEKLFLIDPIRLSPEGCEELESLSATPAGIILTNGNHERDTPFYGNRYSIPIYADPAASQEFSFSTLPIPDRLEGLRTIRLPGAGAGEIAIFWEERSLLVVGDILINLDSFAFAPLPEKYAVDAHEMRKSIQSLAGFNIDTLCFAHGLPMAARVSQRLAELAANLS